MTCNEQGLRKPGAQDTNIGPVVELGKSRSTDSPIDLSSEINVPAWGH